MSPIISFSTATHSKSNGEKEVRMKDLMYWSLEEIVQICQELVVGFD